MVNSTSICAFDVIEHVEDDRRVFREVSRVLKDDGVLICSVPLYADLWTEFDDWVGHARRYDPSDLVAIMAGNQLNVERSAAFGMQPSNPRLVKYGMWWLEHRPRWAMFWYNWVGMPLAMRFQKPLRLVSGFIDTPGVDEVVLVCRRAPRVEGAPAESSRVASGLQVSRTVDSRSARRPSAASRYGELRRRVA